MEQINWTIIEQDGKFDGCSDEGESVTIIKKGNYNGNEFLMFEVKQAYYNNNLKGMKLKTISQSVIQLTK